MALEDAGQAAAAEIGITWRPVPQDGRWHEVPADGKDPRNGAGRIKIFSDGEGGHAWNHITREDRLFWAHSEGSLDLAAIEQRRKRANELRTQAEAERAKAAQEAERKAAALWQARQPATDNPYLKRKGVAAVVTLRQIDAAPAARILGYTPKAKGETMTGPLLLVPLKVGDRLASCQLIDSQGNKHFQAGGQIRGGYWSTGKLPEGTGTGLTLLIAEGVATALSAAEATNFLSVAAMSCGNLPAVAAEMRRRYPEARLIVCSDKGNGEADARLAAIESRALLVVPLIDGEGTDFNDLHALAGLEAVKAQIEAAAEPMPHPAPAGDQAAGGNLEGRSPYRCAMSTADLRKLDIKTEYLVQGLLPKDMITLFYAPSGMGKSTLANQICQAVQDGQPFLGLPTIKTPVFYLDYENPLATIAERLRKLADGAPYPMWHHGCEIPPPQIDKLNDREILFDIQPGTLLVIDTLKASNDRDENKATDMKPLFDFLKQLRKHGLTILLLHHTTKGPEGSYRGSSVIQDQSDHCLSLTKVKAPGSDQAVSEDDDVSTYRLGVRGKTRAQPFKMFLTFDTEKELFALADDPALEQMHRIRKAIERLDLRGEVANQKRIIEELGKDDNSDLAKNKIISLLKRGTGIHWRTEKGMHNATLYYPVAKSGVLWTPIPI